jgi:squalene monooxygenase
MKGRTNRMDVAIVGAGPVGCVAALALADRGARVLLLEAEAGPPRRLAGEWLHPPAAEILARWNVHLPEARASAGARGFVVLPDDASEPIALPYAADGAGVSCEHAALVAALRARAREDPGVRLEEGIRVTALAEQTLSYTSSRGSVESARADLVIGADGRASTVRRLLGFPDGRKSISSMAALLLEGVELPFEGFGHVVLGGPGPALLYAIGRGRVRACFDLPLSLSRCPDAAERLWNGFGGRLPESLRAAFRSALREQPISWATNSFRPRCDFGREGAVLVGDAVGHFHPLTAVGLTLGFQDAVCVAAGADFAAYRCARTAQSRVAEALATALYEAFTLEDEDTRAIREEIFRLWRQDAGERARTMRLLSGQETEPAEFRKVFRTVLAGAFGRRASGLRWARAPRILRKLSRWLEGPLSAGSTRSDTESPDLLPPLRRYSRP